ncbi:MAG TPA: hypothetical protein VF158_10765 [Longimicrobiales bacterium]
MTGDIERMRAALDRLEAACDAAEAVRATLDPVTAVTVEALDGPEVGEAPGVADLERAIAHLNRAAYLVQRQLHKAELTARYRRGVYARATDGAA